MWKIRSFVFAILLAATTVTLFIAASENTGISEETAPGEKLSELAISPGDELQKAVDSLADGGKLILNEGVYDTLEAVVLEGRRNLTVEGIGEVWINTKGIDHHVMTLKGCQNITLSNLKAQHVILEEGDNGPIDDARDGAVVGILEGSGITLENCELVGCGIYGVYAYSASPVVLDGCYLHDNAESAVLFATGAKPVHAVIRNCVITKNAGDIRVQGDVVIQWEGTNRIDRNSPEDYRR